MKGIDVSYAQGAIDWAKVKGQVDFAMLRTGYGWGEHQEDSRFSTNAAGCQAQGIPFGVYHYSYALTPQEAKEEARSCLAILDNRPLQWPVAFDFEEKVQLALPAAAAAGAHRRLFGGDRAGRIFWNALSVSKPPGTALPG